MDKVAFFMWLFPFQILPREYWSLDNTRPAVFTGIDLKTSVNQMTWLQEQTLAKLPGGVSN